MSFVKIDAMKTVISLWARMKFCPNSLRFSFGAGNDGDSVSECCGPYRTAGCNFYFSPPVRVS